MLHMHVHTQKSQEITICRNEPDFNCIEKKTFGISVKTEHKIKNS